jgi:hypothetical protein
MIDSTIGIERGGRRRFGHALALLAVAGAGLAAAAQAAQVRTTSSTGLFTLQDGHSAALTLVETGGTSARPSAVVLELLGPGDQVIARRIAQLEPGRPVRLSYDVPRAGGELIRARARVTTDETNLASAPILTLEVFNDQTLDAFAFETCRMKFDPKGTGGEVLGNCGGCHTVSQFDR